MSRKIFISTCILILTLLFVTGSASAASYNYWDGSEGTDFTEPDNWSTGVLPTSVDECVFNGTWANYFNDSILSSVYANDVNALNIQNGGKLTVNAGGSLDVVNYVVPFGAGSELVIAGALNSNSAGAQVSAYNGGKITVENGGILHAVGWPNITFDGTTDVGGILDVNGVVDADAGIEVDGNTSQIIIQPDGEINVYAGYATAQRGGEFLVKGTLNSDVEVGSGYFTSGIDPDDSALSNIIFDSGSQGNINSYLVAENSGLVTLKDGSNVNVANEIVGRYNGSVNLEEGSNAVAQNIVAHDGGVVNIKGYVNTDSGNIFNLGEVIVDSNGVWDANTYDNKFILDSNFTLTVKGEFYTLSDTTTIFGKSTVDGNSIVNVESGGLIYTKSRIKFARKYAASTNKMHIHGEVRCDGSFFIGDKGGGGEVHIYEGGVLNNNGANLFLETVDSKIKMHDNSKLITPDDEETIQSYIDNTGTVIVAETNCEGAIEMAADANTAAEWAFSESEDGRTVLELIVPPDDVIWNAAPEGGIEYSEKDLTFRSGLNATEHLIYYGPNSVDVNSADIDPANFTTNWQQDSNGVWYIKATGDPVAQDLPAGDLPKMGDEDYHWRVDEVVSGSPVKGEVYTFNIEYVTLDDFEDFTDDSDLETKWYSEYSGEYNLNTNTDYTVDDQSLQLYYPLYYGQWTCERDLTVDGFSNFTQLGANNMSILFKGIEDNLDQKLSIKISDGTNSYTIVYPGPEDLSSYMFENFEVWNIDLTGDMNSVDLSNLDNIKIVLDDIAGASMDDDDELYIDNITLYASRCIDGEGPEADFDQDCQIDLDDVGVLKENWLDSQEDITPVNPGTPEIHYDWDNIEDTNSINQGSLGSSYEYDAQTYQDPEPLNDMIDSSGYIGNCYHSDFYRWEINGNQDHTCYYIPGIDQILEGVDAVTISLWAKGDTGTYGIPTHTVSRMFSGVNNLNYVLASFVQQDGDIGFVADNTGEETLIYSFTGDETTIRDQWNHYAFVKDSVKDKQRIYLNGVMIAELEDNTDFTDVITFVIGGNDNDNQIYAGRIDEFKIFTKALTSAEIAYEADLTGTVSQPLQSPRDVGNDGKIDLKDLAGIADSWGMEVLWP